MQTLETGVERLQQEKQDWQKSLEESRRDAEVRNRESAGLNDQIVYLNERNAVLSKKCVDLLESGKLNKEK